MNLDTLKKRVSFGEAQLAVEKVNRKDLTIACKTLKENQIITEESLQIIQALSIEMRQYLKTFLCELSTSALHAVLSNPYDVEMDYEIKRGNTEIQISFCRDGNKYTDPVNSTGGGAVSVCAMALRLGCMQLMGLRGTLILDQPLNHLSRDLQELAGELLKNLSDKLGIQLIVVNHEDDLKLSE